MAPAPDGSSSRPDFADSLTPGAMADAMAVNVPGAQPAKETAEVPQGQGAARTAEALKVLDSLTAEPGQ